MKLVLLLLTFTGSTFAAERLQNLEVAYDNYFAKMTIKKSKIEFEDPYQSKAISLKKSNRRAWNNLVATLNEEAKDYELLINTANPKRSSDDIVVKRNGLAMPVLRTSSLGNWSRKIEAHWNNFVEESEKICK